MHAGWQRRRVEIDDTPLAYVERGDPAAEPIVLLHGYIGSHLTWRHHIEPLARRHRVLALDWFGWGDSGRSPTLHYDFASEVDRLGRVLDALHVTTCNLFAFDYGGLLSVGLHERHPERVRPLALLNTRAHRAFTPLWNLVFGMMTVGSRTPVVRAMLARMPHTAFHRLSVRYELARGIFDEQILDSHIGWMSKDPSGGRFLVRFFAGYRVRTDPARARGLARIACPTAIIWGRHDPFLPAVTPPELAARIPGATLTLIEARHFVVEERPREVLAALENLLARPAENAVGAA